ncbi:unnamed protein product [Pseudo-nitzschia multistriata]|uniref:FAM86 N-terminal domain-containing protein n=1 Tax=Pseudo-nitzschia multistriata TaxID=183589 RepID=A0A448ZF24_9STRA|nr:unnamed protein product [Pseudo-nitzschia multistriata]
MAEGEEAPVRNANEIHGKGVPETERVPPAERRSCLALVEAVATTGGGGGLPGGRRKVRLELPPRLPPGQRGEDDDRDWLEGVDRTLAGALGITGCGTIELYDPGTQAFRRLDRIDEIPSSCCRLRVAETVPEGPISSTGDGGFLALPWREFSGDIDQDGRFVLGDHSIVVQEESNSGLGTGTNLWDGAVALASFLGHHQGTARSNKDKDNDRDPSLSVEGKRVLELGAGTGLVGIAAHLALGASRVLVTDLEYSMANLEANLSANRCHRTSAERRDSTIDARVLDWCDPSSCETALSIWNESGGAHSHSPPPPDVVLAADVVWVDFLVPPLVETLRRVCTWGGTGSDTDPPLECWPPVVLLSYQRRSQVVEDLLFQSLREASFRTEDVTIPELASSKIRIYRITYQHQGVL